MLGTTRASAIGVTAAASGPNDRIIN
jgi:hypothetical protein